MTILVHFVPHTNFFKSLESPLLRLDEFGDIWAGCRRNENLFWDFSSLLDNVVGKSNDFIGAFFLGLTAISRTVIFQYASLKLLWDLLHKSKHHNWIHTGSHSSESVRQTSCLNEEFSPDSRPLTTKLQLMRIKQQSKGISELSTYLSSCIGW